MATFERETRVAAPLDRVWAFHSTVEGLVALTPGWLGLRVEELRGPDGEPRDRSEPLVAGTLLRLSVRPFGVGPRREWVSAITLREEGETVSRFRDEMRRGPFRRWVHTHRFESADGGTLLRDRVEFETGLGPVVDAAVEVGMEVGFALRHRRTRTLLE